MADSVKTFGLKMGALGVAYKGVGKAVARSGAAVMKVNTLASMRRVAPSGRVRNAGKKGGRLGVNYKIAGDTAIVKATGPWQLIEGNTKGHKIDPKKKRAVLTPSGPRAHVLHPGTHGKHPWRIGVEVGKREVKKVAELEASAPIKAIF